MIAYRLVHPRHSRTAFSGEGAFLAGGRWNSPGVRVVYVSSSTALAVLEVLAYRKPRKPLTPRHLYWVTLDEDHVTWLQPAQLPDDWMVYPHPTSTQALGDAWVKAGNTLVLAVPSVLAPQEHNIVLNCSHQTSRLCELQDPRRFRSTLDLPPTPKANTRVCSSQLGSLTDMARCAMQPAAFYTRWSNSDHAGQDSSQNRQDLVKICGLWDCIV